ncbi:MAG: hypothetical protein NVS3B14_07570 [Ktedonobacteraceae bacterium]
MHLKTAVIQLNSRDNPAENLSKVELFLDRAADMGAEFVALPEFWSYLGPYSGFDAAAQTIPGPFIERLQEKARRHHMIVHGGSIVERCPELPGKFYNTTALINRDGEIAARYRKIHLFDVNLANGEKHFESDRIVPGNDIVTAEIDGITFGLSICYDLRFPELYRLLALRGAQVIVVPAGFTLHTGRDHWEVLLRARAMGFEASTAAELEFRFFRETMTSARDKDFGPNLTPLNPGFNCYSISQSSADDNLLGRIARSMRDYGIFIEGYNREHGPGMYEMNLRYDDAVASGDKTMLFKTGVKEICHQMGLTASFMAKWNDQEDGSSGHSHVSLWDRNRERNLFWDESSDGHMSPLMRQFLAGVLERLPEFMALYAPVINSYKRYVEGTWAPLNTTWGLDNRTCSIRIINNSKSAIRIENRVPGADANFYLVFAATLASGLYGIERQLALPERLQGNAYDEETVTRAIERGHIRPLARNLSTATDLLEQSELAREYLGEDFVEHFVATRRWEVKEYEKAVTNWDRRRYLELI